LTKEQQHQMPQRHAADNAEKAIQMAKYAEQEVKQAREEADPRKLKTAMAKLETAQTKVRDSQQQLSSQDDMHHQELIQVEEQTVQALQDIDAAAEEAAQPKQVR